MGAFTVLRDEYIGCVTSTLIGTWAMDKLVHFYLLTYTASLSSRCSRKLKLFFVIMVCACSLYAGLFVSDESCPRVVISWS
jgi:hypothetical protein